MPLKHVLTFIKKYIMMKKIFFTLILIIIASCTAYLHGEEYMSSINRDYATKQYSIIPPAPEVASLMKYLDIPVSHFTGIPQIDIPIYTVTEGTLSVPISISYKGGGNKQNELPGIISKGWNLNAGVTISRTVHGLPDECNRTPIRGFLNLTGNDKIMRNKIMSKYKEYTPYLFDYNYFFTEDECEDYIKGYVDFANDIFHIYGMGISGTFIYNTFNDVILSSPSNIILKQENKNFTGTLIFYDKDRNAYYFEKEGVDTTKTQISAEGFLDTDSLRYRSAWHITKLKSIQGDVITFEYSKPFYRNDFIGSSQFYINYNTDLKYARIDRGQITSSWHRYNERNLLAIKGKTVTVRFHYDTSQRNLEYISIHRNDSANTELWKYKMLRDQSGNLSTIIQSARNSEQKLYGFLYEPIRDTKSFAIDHWGYCNGKNNTSLLPDLGYTLYNYKKANRESDETYTKQGVLTKIKYPMGGYTNFYWEQNDYSHIIDNGGEIDSNTQTTTTTTTFTLRGTQKEQYLNSGTYTMDSGDYFTIDLSKYLEPLMSGASCFQLEFQSEYETASNHHQQPYPRLDVYKDGVIYKQYDIDKNNSRSIIHITSTGETYQFKLVNPRSFYGMSDTDINNFWGSNPTTDYKNYGYITITKNVKTTTHGNVIRSWGGLRIRKMTSVDESGLDVTKEYLYKQNSKKEYSSGVIFSEPYYESSGYTFLESGDSIYYTQFTGVNSDGIYSSTVGDVGIEYSHVIERYSGELNGEIEYSYDCMKNYPDKEDCLFSEYVPRYFKTLTSNAHHRGNLREKKYFGFVGNYEKKELYKTVSYNYSILEKNEIPTFTGPLYTIMDFYLSKECDSITGVRIDKDYTINKFQLIPYNKRIKSESVWEKDFYYNTESEQTIIYTYYNEENGYNGNPWNSFIRSKSFINSRGQTVTTYYTYYRAENIPLDLKELEITVVDDIVMSARRYEYDINTHKLLHTYKGCVGIQFSNNFNLSQEILGSSTHPTIEKKEYSYMYDPQGNIVQISYNGKILASYLWGYMGKHPIIEAVGVSYADLRSVALSNGYDDQNYIMESLLPDFFNKIRKAFVGQEIMTYTYHWLLGMATSTDSRGVTNTYFLDDFGRLSGVKDTNGYYISKYDYNYKGF